MKQAGFPGRWLYLLTGLRWRIRQSIACASTRKAVPCGLCAACAAITCGRGVKSVDSMVVRVVVEVGVDAVISGYRSNICTSVSATSAGRSCPSISMVQSKVMRVAPSSRSTSLTAWRKRTREPTGTGAVKRTLLQP